MGLLKGLVLGLALASVGAHAQDEIKAISSVDARIMINKSITAFADQIKSAQSLDEVQRVEIARQILDSGEVVQEQLDYVLEEAAKLGETTYLGGLMVTLAGDANLINVLGGNLALGPEGEIGLSVMLKQNLNANDAIRFSTVAIGGFGGTTGGRPVPGQAGRKVETGVRVKLLFATGGRERQAVTLNDFAGPYTGIGAQTTLFGKQSAIQLFTKPETCINANPLACKLYLVSINGSNGQQGRALDGSIKEIVVTFPTFENKQGYGLNF